MAVPGVPFMFIHLLWVTPSDFPTISECYYKKLNYEKFSQSNITRIHVINFKLVRRTWALQQNISPLPKRNFVSNSKICCIWEQNDFRESRKLIHFYYILSPN